MPKRGAVKRPTHVWVIIHCEFFPTDTAPCKHPWMDEMVFHVAGSLRSAQSYVRRIRTFPYSWWKIEQRTIDEKDSDAGDRPATMFYNHRGLRRKSPPHATARRAYDEWQQEEAAASGMSSKRKSRE